MIRQMRFAAAGIALVVVLTSLCSVQGAFDIRHSGNDEPFRVTGCMTRERKVQRFEGSSSGWHWVYESAAQGQTFVAGGCEVEGLRP